MTKPNTTAHIEVEAPDGGAYPGTTTNRRVSVFVNDALWVAIGHLGAESEEVQVRPLGEGAPGPVTLEPQALTVLR